MNSPALLRRLFEHQHWMTANLTAAAGGMTPDQLHRPFEMGPGSPFKVLYHLYRADHLWLAAIEGTPDAPEPPAWATLDELTRAWADVTARWNTLLARVTEADLARPVSRRPPNATVTITTSLADVLLHVATHASYHAAQFTNMARHVGATKLPDVMMITLARNQATAK